MNAQFPGTRGSGFLRTEFAGENPIQPEHCLLLTLTSGEDLPARRAKQQTSMSRVQDNGEKGIHSRQFNAIADEILESLTRQFPVCMASDEFHYFPQARSSKHRWNKWDDFSPEAIATLTRRFSHWKSLLSTCSSEKNSTDLRINIDILFRIITTLDEQIRQVQFYRTQPTFYLTIVGIGLAEALEAGPRAWEERIRNLPSFLGQARQNLQQIPKLFAKLGLEMAEKLRFWLSSLGGSKQIPVGPGMEALLQFSEHLSHLSPVENHFVPLTLYERIAEDHIGCNMPLEAIWEALDKEIQETSRILKQKSAELEPGQRWQTAVDKLQRPAVPHGGIIDLYQSVIDELGAHCQDAGMIDASLRTRCPVRVEPVPEYLMPVRSNAAYSMPPGHPPVGGTFFVPPTGNTLDVPRDLYLLCAHETYPGHHLLDASRWKSEHALRRHVEFPLFYEGWASFSEELLFDTGYFTSSADHLLMATRRFWRALRGRIDLDIHTGRRSLDDAVNFLAESGLEKNKALAMVQRYTLKPGYQLCYTIGRLAFQRLYERSKSNGMTPGDFTRCILNQGEIGLDNVQKLFNE